jgi:hypothetical protein
MKETTLPFAKPPRLEIMKSESDKSIKVLPPIPTNINNRDKQKEYTPIRKSSSLSSSKPNHGLGLMENNGTIKDLLEMGVSSPKLRLTRSELFTSNPASHPTDIINTVKSKIDEIADPDVLNIASPVIKEKTKPKNSNSKKKPSNRLEVKSTEDICPDIKSTKKKKHPRKHILNEVELSPSKSQPEEILLSPLFNHVGLQPQDFKVINA